MIEMMWWSFTLFLVAASLVGAIVGGKVFGRRPQ